MDDPTTWMQAYERAWESNEPADIRALFTDDASYYTEPWIEPWRGVDAIVEGWLERKDEPGNHTFEWFTLVATDEVWVIQGTTAYTGGRTYSNLWAIRPGPDGRAAEFTEWWMDQSRPS
ncbi:nuclear transport factor 2 family protein [Mycetocola sp.]|uniref:nuclear transport factor 2 family protein n=1 Tax=Mycetocola sp. TaxID=1871042 RepID=UPI003989F3C8